MTTGLLLATVARRWYVALLGLCLTLAACLAVHQNTGLYWTQVDVVFLAPKSARYPNNIESTSASLIATAGLVGAELNKGREVPATSSAGATLAGMGVKDGYLIRVPNSGGQWALNYDRPVLDVQVISPDRDQVTARLDELVRRIDAELFRLQATDGVRSTDYITTTSAPRGTQIFYLNGKPLRATVATLLLGVAGTALACLAVDALLRRRARAALERAVAPREAVLTK